MAVRDVAATAQSWWFATSNGITRLERAANSFDQITAWTRYYADDGLMSNDIRAVAGSASDDVLAATAAGLVRGNSAGIWHPVRFEGGTARP